MLRRFPHLVGRLHGSHITCLDLEDVHQVQADDRVVQASSAPMHPLLPLLPWFQVNMCLLGPS